MCRIYAEALSSRLVNGQVETDKHRNTGRDWFHFFLINDGGADFSVMQSEIDGNVSDAGQSVSVHISDEGSPVEYRFRFDFSEDITDTTSRFSKLIQTSTLFSETLRDSMCALVRDLCDTLSCPTMIRAIRRENQKGELANVSAIASDGKGVRLTAIGDRALALTK